MNVATRLLQPFNRPEFQWLQKHIVLALAVMVWATVGLGPYSGRRSPPMHGDFEAQRHWMEITTRLPVSEWYFYDLQWWGLDYPPLTAYHSWLCGKIIGLVNPSWFALDASRGTDDDELKAYMRASVIVSQLALYVPFVYLLARYMAKRYQCSVIQWNVALAAILLQPALVLIDHGHFQYNSVMLGFYVGAVYFLHRSCYVPASVLFVCAIFFKQMALYYAPVVFFYILSRCLRPRFNIARLVGVGCVVVGTSLVLLWPFLSLAQLSQIAVRVFPLSRGLWEDKVANFWCALNSFVKFKILYSPETLQRRALTATLVAMAPSCAAVFARPTRKMLLWASASCAWSFYLFSYQVHEKSVLLPLIPTSLLLLENDSSTSAMVIWINNIACYSLWPLLKRDGLALQSFVVVALWNYLFSGPCVWCPGSLLNSLAIAGSYSAVLALACAEYMGVAPQLSARWPDIWVVLNVTISFGCFAYYWIWHTLQLIWI